MATFSSCLNVKSDVINSRGEENKESRAVKKTNSIFYFKRNVSYLWYCFPKAKEKNYLGAFGSFSGGNLFYFCNTSPPESKVCFKIGRHILGEYA